MRGMRMFISCFISVALLLAACTPSSSSSDDQPPGDITVFPTDVTLSGNVDIRTPQTGSIIYSESLFVAGTASGLPEDAFRLRVVDLNDEVLYDDTVTLDDATPVPDNAGQSWSVEIVHGYSGDPIETQIIALPVDGGTTADYDVETIALSAMENRPDGTFGTILTPGESTTVGGDMILVTGTASGLFENNLQLRLESPSGEVITETFLTVSDPTMMNEIAWQTNLETNGYTGDAVIRAYYTDAATGDEMTIDTVNITLDTAAG